MLPRATIVLAITFLLGAGGGRVCGQTAAPHEPGAARYADSNAVPHVGSPGTLPGADTVAPTAPPEVTPRPWYDTLTVTRARYTHTAPYEELALAVFTTASIPFGLALGALTLLPPSANVLSEQGISRTGIAISAGVGLTPDTSAYIFFPELRLQAEAGYYFDRPHPWIARATVLRDLPLVSIDSRDIFWLGVAGGIGATTDFNSAGLHAEAWVGLTNPMGIRYLVLYPMHNYGLRARAGYDFTTRQRWYELAICATATFWL